MYGISTCICIIFRCKTGLKAYNYQLSIQASEVNKKVKKMQTAVNNLETEINKLQSRDRVLSMVEKDGIKTNQNQIVIIEEENNKNEK